RPSQYGLASGVIGFGSGRSMSMGPLSLSGDGSVPKAGPSCHGPSARITAQGGSRSGRMRMRGMRWLALAALIASLAAAGEATAQGPIKIGFLSPLSGAIAAAGKDMYSGCELFWQESGWQMAGRKVEVVLRTTRATRPPRSPRR